MRFDRWFWLALPALLVVLVFAQDAVPKLTELEQAKLDASRAYLFAASAVYKGQCGDPSEAFTPVKAAQVEFQAECVKVLEAHSLTAAEWECVPTKPVGLKKKAAPAK